MPIKRYESLSYGYPGTDEQEIHLNSAHDTLRPVLDFLQKYPEIVRNARTHAIVDTQRGIIRMTRGTVSDLVGTKGVISYPAWHEGKMRVIEAPATRRGEDRRNCYRKRKSV
jgi:hypothetical protein